MVDDFTASYGIHFLSADGGSRRNRGARIGNYARKHNLKRLDTQPVYDEAHGFNTRTTIRYQER